MVSNRFEGWYFKQQAKKAVIAFIPALHTENGKKSGSLQIVLPERSYYIQLPYEAMDADVSALTIKAGDSTFSPQGVELSIDTKDITAFGRLRFGQTTPPHGDIMGPYRFVPFMECRHHVFSMTHTVEGSLTVDGRLLDFSDGVGYIEGDSGRSFPKRYIWTHCNQPGAQPCSVMLSVADVRPFGREFIGIIGLVYYKGVELRLATYCGARLHLAQDGVVSVVQGDYTLRAQRLEDCAQTLRAPVSGQMLRLVKEGIACRARYTFKEKDNIIFDFISDMSSFEYEF